MKKRNLILRALLVTLVLGSWPGQAFAAKWTKLRTEHFFFIGDASEYEIRRTAQKLEQFRSVMAQLLALSKGSAPAPITVLVFKDETSFKAFRPQFQGRTIEALGYFQPGEDMNYIALEASTGDSSFRPIFHEYTHLLTRETVGNVPVWASEGLAQIYETFQERDGGKGALIGQAPAEHVDLLQNTSTFMPLADLMTVAHDSAVYNEGDRRGVFYAQSWALMHYLMFGSEARSNQLRAYLARIRRGSSAVEAFNDTFGADVTVIEKDLREYIRQLTFRALKLSFDERTNAVVKTKGEPIDQAEADAHLGDLQAHIGRVDEARARLTPLLLKNPNHARAGVALALLELRENKIEMALPLLERAAAAAPNDALAQMALGRALYRQLRNLQREDVAFASTIAKARAAFTAASTLQPDRSDPHALLGYVESMTGSNFANAATHFEAAIRLSLDNEQYRLPLAYALARQEDYAGATRQLGPLIAQGSTEQVRSSARDMLGRIAELRQPRSTGTPAARGLASAPAFVESFDALSPDGPRRGGRIQLFLRDSQPGETRVPGTLRAIDCGTNLITIRVESRGRLLKLTASKFNEVDFITYREDSPSSATCGPLATPFPVLATFRAATGLPAAAETDGQAVAIEFVPDGYETRF